MPPLPNGASMGNLLSENMQFITVCIEDLNEIVGTRFLVGDTPTTSGTHGRVVLTGSVR